MLLAIFCLLIILQPMVLAKGFNLGEVAEDENINKQVLGTLSDWIFGSYDEDRYADLKTNAGRTPRYERVSEFEPALYCTCVQGG